VVNLGGSNNLAGFPPAPGRLQIDAEILGLAGSTRPTTCSPASPAASDGSTAAAHALGAEVDGQAYVDIVDRTGLLNGRKSFRRRRIIS